MSALYVCLFRTEIIYANLPQTARYPHLIPVPQTAIMGNPNWCIYLLCQLSRKPPASCCIYSILFDITSNSAPRYPHWKWSIVPRTSRKLGHFNINSDVDTAEMTSYIRCCCRFSVSFPCTSVPCTCSNSDCLLYNEHRVTCLMRVKSDAIANVYLYLHCSYILMCFSSPHKAQ